VACNCGGSRAATRSSQTATPREPRATPTGRVQTTVPREPRIPNRFGKA